MLPTKLTLFLKTNWQMTFFQNKTCVKIWTTVLTNSKCWFPNSFFLQCPFFILFNLESTFTLISKCLQRRVFILAFKDLTVNIWCSDGSSSPVDQNTRNRSEGSGWLKRVQLTLKSISNVLPCPAECRWNFLLSDCLLTTACLKFVFNLSVCQIISKN